MQAVNQVILILFALILLSIYSTTYHARSSIASYADTKYWSISILLRAASCIAWVLVPIFGLSFLLVANACYIGSMILLVLFIRSWATTNTTKVKIISFGFWLAFVITFAWFLAHENSFLTRVWVSGLALMVLSSWELIVVFEYRRKDHTHLLLVILVVVVLQVLITVTSLFLFWFHGVPKADSIIEASANHRTMLSLWITLGAHLLSYITINSFLYNKLWDSERSAHNTLKEQQQQLRKATHEKEEVRRLLEERERLIDGLISANKTAATGALAASIAHELGQPLAVIQMNTELLYKHAHTPEQIKAITPNEYLHILGGILKNNHLAAGIIKTLRGIFSQEKPQFESIDLKQLVYSVVQLAKTEMDHQQVRLHIDIPDNIRFDGFPNELFQVILNLLNNAIQALAATTATDRAIRIQARRKQNRIVISVSDNGPGIAPENQSKLFQLFALGSKAESMGLGLWLCHYIVNRHNGVIRYEPSESGGANFLIDLPLSQA